MKYGKTIYIWRGNYIYNGDLDKTIGLCKNLGMSSVIAQDRRPHIQPFKILC